MTSYIDARTHLKRGKKGFGCFSPCVYAVPSFPPPLPTRTDAFNPDEERLIGALRIERKIKIPTAKGSKSRGNYIGNRFMN